MTVPTQEPLPRAVDEPVADRMDAGRFMLPNWPNAWKELVMPCHLLLLEQRNVPRLRLLRLLEEDLYLQLPHELLACWPLMRHFRVIAAATRRFHDVGDNGWTSRVGNCSCDP